MATSTRTTTRRSSGSSTPRSSRRPPAARTSGNVAVALGAALAICLTVAAAQEEGAREPDVAAYVLGAAIAAPLLVRRRWPLGALIASALLLQAYYAADYPGIGVAVPLAVAVYTAVAAGRLWETVAIAGVLELMAIVYRAIGERESLVSIAGLGTVADVSLLAAVILLAETVRGRRELAERRVEQERTRIARDLHDVLAHTIAVIGVHAGVAEDALGDDPEQARASLRTIREQGREATAELRAAVGALRAPAPRLDDLERLVETVSGPELEVTVSVLGERRPLAPAVELTAYRVAQEALTNVVRHAGAASATVALAYEPGALVLEVRDDGRGGAGASRDGRGIAGMRERVQAVGGTLEAGPAPGAGFRVLARLPEAG